MGRFFGAALTLALAGLTSAHGQQPRLNQLNQVSKLDRTTGVLEAAAPGMVQVLDSHGTRWMVSPAPNGRVSVRGETTRDMLQKGQAVSCEVMLDEVGKVTEPVKAVVFTDGAAVGVASAAPLGTEPGGKPARGRRPAGNYIVSGSIKMTRDDTITVMAGKERFEITVAPDAAFTIDTANVGLATKGDAVEMEGMYLRKGQLQATVLQIKLANPVIPPPPKGKPRPKAAAE